jgi:hypothetical protein
VTLPDHRSGVTSVRGPRPFAVGVLGLVLHPLAGASRPVLDTSSADLAAVSSGGSTACPRRHPSCPWRCVRGCSSRASGRRPVKLGRIVSSQASALPDDWRREFDRLQNETLLDELDYYGETSNIAAPGREPRPDQGRAHP